MANTYTQIYIHIVFAVKGRQNLISKEKREELHKFITGVVSNRNQKLFAVFAMPDHLHLLVSMGPTCSVSDLVRDIKAGSSKFINEKGWMNNKFNWQEGYGAFSYSRSGVDSVVKYILNQEEHHQKKTFREEYFDFLTKFEIEYDPKYVFEWIED
ncbi:IS200/IS605 family transposase [Chryseobacterium indologenes]|uniref:IS200/IS605 family transposase n=1 Tax=Chryseobacterium indologenes TaxID=253 RepID=A0AAD0YSZ1_CHRID|nr:IS200/IS605 family transposase [Chryseobacterium indologenes]AYZ35925.1 IS200/IS605 family transposase [Chryseobacterium indologenes]AZB16672.1 IS200/IS605 family transposase [Chryseobacterium indologenes]MBF6644709.1 IS200/IS605 family transposase [Chryseobacterium indologenes]MBU3048248.1 IS200/IS605 family transposase [Chryseobacterium indologenes]MEB4759703.1 IS200/IS605 family transposase [Chryseobacterium indologenes]